MRPANPFPKGNTVGLQTRFQRGNRASVGYGRPRTSLLNRKLRKELYYDRELNLEAQVKQWLAFALAGSETHAKLIEKHVEPETLRQIGTIVKESLEKGSLFQWRRPKRKSYSTRESGENRPENAHLAHKIDGFRAAPAQDGPNSIVFNETNASAPGNRATETPKIDGFRPQSLHELAAHLVGAPDRPAEAPAPAKKRVKVELW
jgi:hypothetical protein